MAPQVLRKNCKRCAKNFFTYDEGKLFCTDVCESKLAYEVRFSPRNAMKRIEAQCEHCGGLMNAGVGVTKKYCTKSCSLAAAKMVRQEKACEKSFEEKKPRKKTKGLSFKEMERRAEYRRLYDEFEVGRIISGKARDLI